MKLILTALRLQFSRSQEVISLGHVTFFYGKIGAGKSSIARLIDYCLGADIRLTPALQQEFVEAALQLEVAGRPLMLYRQREASKLVAVWQEGDQTFEVLVPARKADGVVLPNTTVEVLSDLLFYLAGMETPLVRKNKKADEVRLERLSFRDLFRFCYLDQDGMDSDLFRLDLESDWARRQKSIDAMRFILGYHQDRVAALEAELQEVHEEKMAARAAAAALKKVLEDAGFSNPAEIDVKVEGLRAELDRAKAASASARKQGGGTEDHAVDILRESGRNLSGEIQALEEMTDAIGQRLSDTERHLNELKMLSVRFHRTSSARSLLAGVDFHDCPRCTRPLPSRIEGHCPVCDQNDAAPTKEHVSDEVVMADLKSRTVELMETVAGLKTQSKRVERSLQSARTDKILVDTRLNEKLAQYDSAFLSRALEFERQVTYLEQQVESWLRYRQLPDKLAQEFASADELQGKESTLRAALLRERAAAFKDRANLDRLQELLLDCLVRAAFPGVDRSFVVRIDPRNFEPELAPSAEGDFAVTSFANMGSGGMKSIFKSCYALALHRLATETGAALPSLIILDSAMKNVSERENRELFEAFFKLVYELAANELCETQFIIIDKEMPAVPPGLDLSVLSRHMAPGSRSDSPLIPYFGIVYAPEAVQMPSTAVEPEPTSGDKPEPTADGQPESAADEADGNAPD